MNFTLAKRPQAFRRPVPHVNSRDTAQKTPSNARARQPMRFLPVVQAKLRIGAANDECERQAERVADQVVSMPRTQTASGEAASSFAPVEAKSQPTPDHIAAMTSCVADSMAHDAPPSVANVIEAPGRPLDRSALRFMERQFGQNFSDVRIHTDADADRSAREIDALAYTVRDHIAFREGQYAPRSPTGRHLLAHELTHVLSQRRSAPPVQRQGVPPAGAACRATENAKGKTEKLSPRIDINERTPPCFSCPNSPPDVCPKLAQKIFPPVATAPVQFSWQVDFLTMHREKGIWGKGRGPNDNFVVQMIEKAFNFSVPPADPYPFTPLYWEAFPLNDAAQTEIDYWQFELPDLSAGSWEMEGTLYLTDQLPNGMAVGNVADAGGVPSTAAKPDRLGAKLATRRIAGEFDFTGPAKRHFSQP
jgi:hypothetical protein